MKIPLILVTLAAQVGTLFDCPPSLILAIAKVESTFDLYALGDRDPQGVPHSFGPWQLNDRGVGAGYSPAFLLDLHHGAYLTGKELARLHKVFEGDLYKVIAAWRVGESGVKSEGWRAVQPYVEQILEAKEEYQIFDQVTLSPEVGR